MIYKEGSRGDMVKRIQRVIGCYPDGVWGKLTTEAVKAWQSAHSLTPDGVAGPATLAKMGLTAMTPTENQNGGCVGSVFGVNGLTLKRSKRRIDYIAIHCTATPEGRDMTVEQIRAEHKKNGWADCGYHYIIYRDGSVHAGRDVDIIGAHVAGYNAYSIGIAYVGGLENRPGVPYNKLKAKDTRTDAQKAALLSLLMDLRKLYPRARIQGHRDFSPDSNHNGIVEPSEWVKACPSFDAKKEYEKMGGASLRLPPQN